MLYEELLGIMAMFARSPALPASRPTSLIDPHHPAEYPILLGDGFKDPGNDEPSSLNLRYNWKAQKPGSISRMHIAKSKSSSEDAYDLTIEDRLHRGNPYNYRGRILENLSTGKGSDGETASDQSLALLWNAEKLAFILEPVSASLDFNLTSAPDQTQRDINAHKKLRRATSNDADAGLESSNGPALQASDSDSDPDSNNPYDYRHFLAEARENTSDGPNNGRSRTPIPGSRTPVPDGRTPVLGSRTPIPGFSSPTLGAHKLTTQFHATSGPSTKKRKPERSSNPPRAKPKPQASRKPQPLSSERIIDSDDDASSSTAAASHRKQLSVLNSPTRASSPHLIVSDVDAELEIDLGSPPPAAVVYTQRKRVNPEAFRHRNAPKIDREDKDGDVEMADADVEDFELGSPRSGAPGGGVSAVHTQGRIERQEEEEEEDDGLAAELEAALEEEEEEETEGVGLGITSTPGKEDESEVSEEE